VMSKNIAVRSFLRLGCIELVGGGRVVCREAKGPFVEGKCLLIQRDFQWGK